MGAGGVRKTQGVPTLFALDCGSLLSKRSQSTHIGSTVSNKEDIVCGVPQGSVLGPLLFLIYVNDIYRCPQAFDFYLFADDTNLLYSNKDLKDRC